MKMNHSVHYFPNNNAQVLDIVALAFFIAATLTYAVFLGVKLVRAVFGRSNSGSTANGQQPKAEEYRLTSMAEDDDEQDEFDTAEEVRVFYQQKRRELAVQLVRLRKTCQLLAVGAAVMLAMGLYLGVRSVCYGMGYVSRSDGLVNKGN